MNAADWDTLDEGVRDSWAFRAVRLAEILLHPRAAWRHVPPEGLLPRGSRLFSAVIGHEGVAVRVGVLSVRAGRDRHACPTLSLGRADRLLPGPWAVGRPTLTLTWGSWAVSPTVDEHGLAAGRIWVEWEV